MGKDKIVVWVLMGRVEEEAFRIFIGSSLSTFRKPYRFRDACLYKTRRFDVKSFKKLI
jgi:hypothetical protein